MSGGVNSSATIITLDSGSTLPTTYPYTLVIDPDLATEEIVTVTSSTGVAGQLNVTRGQDGTTAQSHSNGSVVRHMVTGRDLGEAQSHIEAVGAYSIINNGENPGVTTTNITKTLHGIGADEGVVVGTLKAQTLTLKTLTSPTINTPTISTPTVSNGTFSAPAISGGTVSGATISGGTISATPISISAGNTLTMGSAGIISAESATITAVEVSYLDGVTSNIQTQLNGKISNPGAWTSWTPVWSGTGASAGNATVAAAYSQVGKTIHFRISVTYASSSSTASFGSSGVSFYLSSTPGSPIANTVGQCIAWVGGSGNRYAGEVAIGTDRSVTPLATPATAGATSRPLTTTVPFTWGTSDVLLISGTYEVA